MPHSHHRVYLDALMTYSTCSLDCSWRSLGVASWHQIGRRFQRLDRSCGGARLSRLRALLSFCLLCLWSGILDGAFLSPILYRRFSRSPVGFTFKEHGKPEDMEPEEVGVARGDKYPGRDVAVDLLAESTREVEVLRAWRNFQSLITSQNHGI